MVALSTENPRYGYRRVWALLGREGWAVNKKRVQRLWREAGLKVPAKKVHKRRRLGTSENGCTRRRALYIDHVCSYDFAMDATEDGRRLKMMPNSGRVQQGVSGPEDGALDHRRGRGRDPGSAVHRA